MPNERRLRLNQVAREFKVGQNTLIEFLQKKGIQIDHGPSSIIEPPVYEVLAKEFGGNQTPTVNIRERIAAKHETVSLETRSEESTPAVESPFREEVVVKSSVIETKAEVEQPAGPKILGKIELPTPTKKGAAKPAATPKAEAAPAPKKSEATPEAKPKAAKPAAKAATAPAPQAETP